jgi:hypothetical protein
MRHGNGERTKRGSPVSDKTNETPQGYKAPAIKVIGTLSDLTMGVDGKGTTPGADSYGYTS